MIGLYCWHINLRRLRKTRRQSGKVPSTSTKPYKFTESRWQTKHLWHKQGFVLLVGNSASLSESLKGNSDTYVSPLTLTGFDFLQPPTSPPFWTNNQPERLPYGLLFQALVTPKYPGTPLCLSGPCHISFRFPGHARAVGSLFPILGEPPWVERPQKEGPRPLPDCTMLQRLRVLSAKQIRAICMSKVNPPFAVNFQNLLNNPQTTSTPGLDRLGQSIHMLIHRILKASAWVAHSY